jgi:hypothetical protein
MEDEINFERCKKCGSFIRGVNVPEEDPEPAARFLKKL